jgi:hypothetical protein
VVESPFCSQCGERLLEPRDLTLRGLLERIFHAVTNLDGRTLRTSWDLLRRPGALTAAYLGGKRKPYLAPFQVFLLANVLFFAVQSVSNSSVFGTRLDSHLHVQDWQATARHLVDARLEQRHVTLAHYEAVFNRVVEANAKSLVILMTVPFALLLWLLFRRTPHPFITHAALSLHVWAFVLVVFSLALLIADVDTMGGGQGLRSARMDNVLSAVNVVACAVYLYLGIGVVYQARGVVRAAKALVLTLALGVIVLGYRFLVFLITLFATT